MTDELKGFVKVGKQRADEEPFAVPFDTVMALTEWESCKREEDVFAENVRLHRQIFRLQERLAKLMLERRQEGNARRELKRIAKRLLKFAE